MASSDYALLYSTNEIFRDTDDTRCLTDDLDDIESNITALQTNKSDIDHTHTDYAPNSHTHSGYATSEHTHSYSSITDAPTALPSNGGNADRLNTNAGDANTPVYFADGVPVACTSLDLNTTGSAAKLTTARTIRTNLTSTSAVSFDGSTNVTPGVTGTLPIANGGTGATTVSGALTNLGNIGKVYSNLPSSKSISKMTLTTIASLTLPAGTYVVVGNHQWNINGDGYMYVSRLTKSDDSVVYCVIRNDMIAGGGAVVSTIVELEETTTIKYETYHQYTSAVNAEAIRFYAVKIK